MNLPSTTWPTYPYRQLEEDEIRLLILRPSQSFSAPLHVSMHTANFFNRPVYKALSYVWGSSKETSAITVNGVPFNATTNLASALRHIRNNRLAEILWVDAICINQQRINERNHQVNMMPRIYESAQEVIAWLGESYDDSDEAMRLLHRWGSALASIGVDSYNNVRPKLDWFRKGKNADDFIARIEQPFTERAWNALKSLYKRPYWRRLWIFQEFVLAKNVSIMCGSVRLEWACLLADVFFCCWEEAFADSTSVLALGGPAIYKMVQENVSHSHIDYMLHDLLRWRDTIHEPRWREAAESLLELIWKASFRDCTDPRDHVFAMAGFSSYGSHAIVVDYSLSIDDTNIEFARSCILHSDFQVLSFAGIGYKEVSHPASKFPSWAPEWDALGKTGHSTLWPLKHMLYSAGIMAHHFSRRPRSGSSHKEIIIRAMVIDTVVEVLEGGSGWETPEDGRWKDIVFRSNEENVYINGMPLLQAYFRTLLADWDCHWVNRLDELHEMQEEMRETIRPTVASFGVNFLKSYCADRSGSSPNTEKDHFEDELRMGGDVPASLGLGSFFAKGEEPRRERWAQTLENAQKHAQVFVNARLVGSRGRSFFTTSKGYMGTGPPFAKKADVVCVFEGARVPFLLRKHEMGYFLVGEAFILGLMDGEACANPKDVWRFENIALY